MGRNIFVSYKYSDSNVLPLGYCHSSTARDYVNELEKYLGDNGHAYYGEEEGEDLSYLDDDQIWERLKNKIFPTSCTIVLISPNMKVPGKNEKSQWIPWEVSFSLRETSRGGYTSHRNGILAVVLPDRCGSYNYALENKYCCSSSCVMHYRENLFSILKENMFNAKQPSTGVCPQYGTVSYGEPSYIPMVKWCDFVRDINGMIERAERIKDNASAYDLHIDVNK